MEGLIDAGDSLLHDLTSAAALEGQEALDAANGAMTKFNDATSKFDTRWKPLEITKITQKADGSWDITRGQPPKEENVNSREMEKTTRPTFDKEGKLTPPDFKSYLGNLGLENLDTKEMENFLKQKNESWLNSDVGLKFQQLEKLAEIKAAIENSGMRMPDETQSVEERGKNAETVTKDTGTWNKINDMVKKGGKAGKWLVTKIPILAAGFGAYELYQMIHEHQMAMNGCWYVNTQTGEKTKVVALTCNNDLNTQCSTSTGTGSSSCVQTTYCEDLTKCYGTASVPKSAFNPCPITTPPAPVSGKHIWPGNHQESPSPFCFQSAAPGTGTGNACGTCVGQSNCDTKTSCSTMCDSGAFPIQAHHVLQCVDVDWGGALADWLGTNPFSGVGGFGSFIKILIWVVVGCVSLWILSLIIEFFRNMKKRVSG